MNNSNLIQDTVTRNAVKKIEDYINRIESIQHISTPSDASDELRVVIQAINKITNSFKRRT